MEITRNALLKIVRAARKSNTLSKLIGLVMNREHGTISGVTTVDEISGDLNDFLFEYTGEKLNHNQDFLIDSRTYKAITSPFSDEYAMDQIVRMHNANTVEQPVPHTIEPEEMRGLVEKNGGYMFDTPEGDWNNPGLKIDSKVLQQVLQLGLENATLKENLKTCVNELCLECGKYHREHEGACEGCRWLPIRRGGMDE